MIIKVDFGGRVDKLLADALPQYSRAAIHKLFSMDLIKLDGVVVKPGHKVREGATIEADLSPLQQEQQVEILPILFEDKDVVVIDKPTGIISHSRGRYWYEPSVASFLRFHIYGPSTENGEPTLHSGTDRAGIIHRLDRATSGVMICAKNEETTKFLQKQFADRKVEKTYIAILEKTPEKHEAIIDAPIERNPKKPSQFRVGPNGKVAQTHYKVLKTSDSGRCLVEFTPKTGRTHQLRVHAVYIGCAILGDSFYGTEGERLFLHANKLTVLTANGDHVTYESPLPKEFENALI